MTKKLLTPASTPTTITMYKKAIPNNMICPSCRLVINVDGISAWIYAKSHTYPYDGVPTTQYVVSVHCPSCHYPIGDVTLEISMDNDPDLHIGDVIRVSNQQTQDSQRALKPDPSTPELADDLPPGYLDGLRDASGSA